jgi:hypothetical protein
MKRIFLKCSLVPSLILVLGEVFASRVLAKSSNTHTTENPYGADALIHSPGSNDVVFTVTNHFEAVCVLTDANKNYVNLNTAKNFTDPLGQLAIGRFGAQFPHDGRGLIRNIFPDIAVLGRNINAWNWPLSVIRVR